MDTWKWCEHYMEWQLISQETGTVLDYLTHTEMCELAAGGRP